MNSLSRAAKMMRDIIYRRLRIEHAENFVSLIFWQTWRNYMQAFCNNKLTFYYQ